MRYGLRRDRIDVTFAIDGVVCSLNRDIMGMFVRESKSGFSEFHHASDAASSFL